MALDITPLTPTRFAIKLANDKRSELDGVTQQIAGGEKYRSYSGYASEGTLQSVLSLEAAVKESEGFVRSNNSAIAKIDVIETSLDSIQDIAKELSSLIVNRQNGASGDDIPINEVTDSLIGRIQSNLNTTYNGRYLFSGSKTDVPPVSDTVFDVSNIADDVAGANYYNGDSFNATVRQSPGQELEYGVNADASGFKKLIGAAHLLLDGHNKDDNNTLQDAQAMINEAVEELASERAVVRGNRSTLRETNVGHEDLKLLLEANFESKTQTDIVEASTRLSELEATVQASFSAWSRLNKLRLSDFI